MATADHQPFQASFEAATPGTLQVTALAHDDGGGETVSVPQSVTIVANGPGIMAHVSPAPSGTGWYSGDVTVTFECSPGSAPLISCSPPQDASADGRDVQVVGEAVDSAGLRAVAVVVLNVDQTAPRLSIYAPEDGDFIDPSSTTATIRGNVLEPVSGVRWLTCGGVTAAAAGSGAPAAVEPIATEVLRGRPPRRLERHAAWQPLGSSSRARLSLSPNGFSRRFRVC